MNRQTWPWMRDFALVGGLTGFLAPFLVIREAGYATATGLGGAVSGALLGRFTSWLLASRARRWPKLVFLPFGILLGSLWGSSAALATVVGGARDVLGLSLFFAGLAGADQLGWFWLAYSYRRVNGRSTGAVVALASLLGSGLGYAGFLAFMVLMWKFD